MPTPTAAVDTLHSLSQPHIREQDLRQKDEVERRQGLRLEVERQRPHRKMRWPEFQDGHACAYCRSGELDDGLDYTAKLGMTTK